MFTFAGPPSQPVMYSVPGPGEVTTGDTVTVHCDLATAGNPPADITWYQGNTRVPDSQVTRDLTAAGGLTSTITVVISDITYFTCEASNEATSEKLRSKMSIKPVSTTKINIEFQKYIGSLRKSSGEMMIMLPFSFASQQKYILNLGVLRFPNDL